MRDNRENVMLEVGQDDAGQRLDRLLALVLPGMGLRGRRRLIEAGRVVVDGRIRSASYRVAAGQRVTVRDGQSSAAAPCPAGLRVVRVGERFAAVHKPAGAHSETLAGGGQGVSAWLSELLGGTDGSGPLEGQDWHDTRLVNRLDQPTSGLLLVARDAEAEQEFRRLEDAGLVRKEYAAVVHGRVEEPMVLRFALDSADRKKVRPVGGARGETSDPLRWTEMEPVRYDPARNRTLLRAVIRKGARHQIRVHLALHGHAIVGDALYGPAGESGRLHLHHARLDMPGFGAESPPDWE